MISFHGKQELKDQLIQNLKTHQERDQIVQGSYWDIDEQKGCAVGCSIVDFGGKVDNHSEYERLFGIPKAIARLEDGIFEGLSVDDSKCWPVDFASAVPVGVDLSSVVSEFIIWVLVDPEYGVIRHGKEDGKKAIERVADLYKKRLNGKEPGRREWRDAADAADAVAADAAYAAAAAAYARNTTRKVQSGKLIEILKSRGVSGG